MLWGYPSWMPGHHILTSRPSTVLNLHGCFCTQFGSRFLLHPARVEQLPCILSMLQGSVVLASGRSESISIPQSSKVGDLKILAQKSLEQGFLKLVTQRGAFWATLLNRWWMHSLKRKTASLLLHSKQRWQEETEHFVGPSHCGAAVKAG